jgi:hypothetical protein
MPAAKYEWLSAEHLSLDELYALRKEVSVLLLEARVLAASAARIRSFDHDRLRSSPSAQREDVSRVFSEEPLVLSAVSVELRGSIH